MKIVGVNLDPQYIAKQVTAWGIIFGFIGGVLTSVGMYPMFRSEFVAYAAQDYSEKCLRASADLMAAISLLEYHKDSDERVKQAIRINIATYEAAVDLYCAGYS